MRYNIKQYLPLKSDMSVDWVIKGAKKMIAMDLVDKIPFEISYDSLNDPDVISIEFDLWIEKFEDYYKEHLKKDS